MKSLLGKLDRGKIYPYERKDTDNKEYQKLISEFLNLKKLYGDSSLPAAFQQSQDKDSRILPKKILHRGVEI